MKKSIILFTLFASIFAKATLQIHDVLIIEKDTLWLETYPLELLDLKTRPFDDALSGKSHNSACHRGYQAIWRIVENRLYLEKIIKCYPHVNQQENLVAFFAKNNINITVKHGRVLADWVNVALFQTKFHRFLSRKKRKKILTNRWEWRGKPKKRKTKLIIKNGWVTRNRF